MTPQETKLILEAVQFIGFASFVESLWSLTPTKGKLLGVK